MLNREELILANKIIMNVLNPKCSFNDFFNDVGRRSLLMLDYDGTLAPFHQNRMQALPYPGIRERLNMLMQAKAARVVIISGRSLDELKQLLKIPLGMELWGSHGLQRQLPNGAESNTPVDPRWREGLDKCQAICSETFSVQFLEVKPYALALHWRGIDQPETLETLQAIGSRWNAIGPEYGLEVRPFDAGLELLPKNLGKGEAVRQLLGETTPDTAIAYLGDDITDENAFEALGDRGLKVLVRKELRPTLADIQLVPPDELLAFLDRWISSSREISHA